MQQMLQEFLGSEEVAGPFLSHLRRVYEPWARQLQEEALQQAHCHFSSRFAHAALPKVLAKVSITDGGTIVGLKRNLTDAVGFAYDVLSCLSASSVRNALEGVMFNVTARSTDALITLMAEPLMEQVVPALTLSASLPFSCRDRPVPQSVHSQF